MYLSKSGEWSVHLFLGALPRWSGLDKTRWADADVLDDVLEGKERCGVEKAAVTVAEEAKAAFFEGWGQRAWRLAKKGVAARESTDQQQRCLLPPPRRCCGDHHASALM